MIIDYKNRTMASMQRHGLLLMALLRIEHGSISIAHLGSNA
jgi:hypothetical protein